MSVFLRTLALVLLLCGEAQATNADGMSGNSNPPDLPLKGMILPGNMPQKLVVCENPEDIKTYVGKRSEADAERFFAWKYAEDKCWMAKDDVTVHAYVDVVGDALGRSQCIMRVAIDTLWLQNRPLYAAWLMRHGVTAARCRPE